MTDPKRLPLNGTQQTTRSTADGTKDGMDVLVESDERGPIAMVSATQTSSRSARDSNDKRVLPRAEEALHAKTFADAMQLLNEILVAFLTQQLVLFAHGDMTDAVNEYIEYVRQLRAKFAWTERKAAVPEQTLVDLWPEPPRPPHTELKPEAESSLRPARAPATTPVVQVTDQLDRPTASADQKELVTTESVMEKKLMELLARTTETQQQLANQQGDMFQSLGQHTAEVDKLQQAMERMEALLDAREQEHRQPAFPPSAQLDTAQDTSQFGGFLASANTYGAYSIWNDPALLQFRVEADTIQSRDVLFSSTETELRKGMWKGTTHIVIKRLPPPRQTMANALVLATNVKTIASLSHPRLVTFMGVHWDKTTEMQVASELMDGGDLRSVLDSMEAACTLTWATFKCQVAIDIADALAFVRTQPTHVPFSCLPSSRKVLLSRDGRAKLNLVQGTDLPYQRRTHHVRYMAPEVIKGVAVSSSSDLYAFGVLLCELDTTRPPYEDAVRPDGAKLSDELVAKQVAAGLLMPQTSNDCPKSISKLIEHCTAYDPSARPTAASVAYALRQILKTEL